MENEKIRRAIRNAAQKDKNDEITQQDEEFEITHQDEESDFLDAGLLSDE